MTIYIVTSQSAEKAGIQYHIDEIKLFSNFNSAKAYAKHRLKKILEIFNTPKDKVRIAENGCPGKEELVINVNFQYDNRELNSWILVQKKKVE